MNNYCIKKLDLRIYCFVYDYRKFVIVHIINSVASRKNHVSVMFLKVGFMPHFLSSRNRDRND